MITFIFYYLFGVGSLSEMSEQNVYAKDRLENRFKKYCIYSILLDILILALIFW